MNIVCAVPGGWQSRHADGLRHTGATATFVDDGTALVEHLARDWSVDLVILDFGLATVELARRFDGAGPRLIGFGDSTNAGFALGAADVEFVDESIDIPALLDAIDRPLAAVTGVADLSDRSAALRNALGAEAERVAAAIARLSRSAATGEIKPVNAASVRAMIAVRRARDRYFPADLFGDPAWDMMLDLFAAHLEGGRVSVSSLCIAAAVPTATALRWIRMLCGKGMFERQPDPSDARRAFVSVSAPTIANLHAYFGAIAGVVPV